MRRWALRISGIFLFSSLFVTSPALADPRFSVHFGFPGVYVGFGHGYYPGYAYYPRYADYPPYGYYPRYAYSYPYYYPRYAYPRFGYYGHRTYWGGVRHVRPAYYGHWRGGGWRGAGWHGGGWRGGGWRGGGWRGAGWHGGRGRWR